MEYYKAVTFDKKSWYDKKTIWRAGRIIRPDMIDELDAPCGHGIHCSPSILGAIKYQSGSSIYCLVEPRGRILGQDNDKIRCESVKCLHFLTPAETDKAAGFKLWEAMHPVNPLLLNLPQKQDKWLMDQLINWDSVWASVRDSVRESVGASVWASVGASVGDSVRASVRDSVWASVGAYVCGLFPNIKNWKYAEKLGPNPWRPLLNLWYAGYFPSFDGNTWRLHHGKEAEIVLKG